MPDHSHPVIRNRNIVVQKSPGKPPPDPPSERKSTAVPLVILSDAVHVAHTEIEPLHVAVVEPEPELEPEPRLSPNLSTLITAIITNYKTHKLVETALSTFVTHYPSIRVILVDNGSGDSSTEYIRQAATTLKTVDSLLLDDNIGHGPAMHKAVQLVKTQYIFTMDSDCEVLKGGFLEQMYQHFQSNSRLYAVGWLRMVDSRTGVASDKKRGKYLIKYIHPSAMLLDKDKYDRLTPFQHTGAPATDNMLSARQARYSLVDFPVKEYINHLVAGTRRMYSGRWNPREGDKPNPWEEGSNWPI